MKKVTPGQLDKYDIDQKIIRTLVDFEARTIIVFGKKQGKKSRRHCQRDQDSHKQDVFEII